MHLVIETWLTAYFPCSGILYIKIFICLRVFKTESGLATHIGLHHGGEQKNRNAMGTGGGLDDFVCHHCGKQLKNQLQLRNHIAKVHPNANDDGNKCLHASTLPESSFIFSVQTSTLAGALADGQEDQISQVSSKNFYHSSSNAIYKS